MTEIYKLIHLDEDNVKNMIVFYGNSDTDNDLTKLFLSDRQNIMFEGIFSKEEMDKIITQNIPVIFSTQIIYLDDTIETIKKKIIIALDNNISFDEMYLFGKQVQELNNSKIYEFLTQNGKIELTQNIFFQFLSNIDNVNIDLIPIKSIYSYNDVIDLNLNENSQLVNIPLGQRSILGDSIYSFSSNPFKLIDFDKILKFNADNVITTTNKDLLLSNGFLFENTIYLCSAMDVFKSVISKNISETVTTKIYFPFLNIKNINDIKSLNDNRLELLDDNKNLVNVKFDKQINNISLFHKIYNSRKNELNYIEQGINIIHFSMAQDSEYNVPLDIIFKLIHATKKVPLIKFNPSKKQEKIYRLYCDKVAKNGRKIPYLSKGLIFKLTKSIGQSRRVSCYIEHTVNDNKIPIVLEFDNLANIYVNIEFKDTKSIPDIEEIVKKSVNPIVSVVKEYLESSGYSMKLFNNLYDKSIDIINIKYFSYISIDKNINLNNLLGCVSSIFNVLVGELKKGIVMRYKRVSNFNEMDSQEAFIVELLNRANEDEDIVKLLMDNYQLSETDAQLKIADLLNSLQVVQTLNKTRKLKIKNNPGFLTKITQDQFKQNIMIEMDNINNIFYMSIIPIYLDSLIRITQYPESSDVKIETIDTLCKTRQIDDLDQVDDIVAPSEKKITENVPVAIAAEDLTFGEATKTIKDKSVNVLDFLYDDDSDYEDDDDDEIQINEEELKGGNSDEGIDIDLDDDDGISVDMDDDDGISVDMDDDDEDEGVNVDLDNDDEGVSVDLDDDEDEGVSVDLDNDDEGVSVDLDNDDEDEGVVVKEKTPSPIKEKTPSPIKEKKSKIIRKPTKLSIQGEEKLEKNITGMKIADPNPFFRELNKKDPILFLTESDGKYDNYSRACPWNKRRQPVILTDKEKEKIDIEHPGSYEHAIKYGSNPDKQFWYICPRYWDLKTNTSLTKEEVDSGKYGGIIPQDAKVVPPGANIWEFKSKDHMGKDGEYTQHYPGFLKDDKHPDGLCIPCCFKTWDKPGQIKRREQCKQNEIRVDREEQEEREEVSKDKINTSKNSISKQDIDDYIKGPDKFPLQVGRFGYLPFILQTFIGTDNKKCQVNITNKNLKKKHPCFLRKGVEGDKNKSFIGCISDIASDKEVKSIKNFITDVLVKMLTPDVFINLQNGSLITQFQDTDLKNIDTKNIEGSDIFKKLKDKNKIQLERISSAYKNFVDYLQSPSSYIDYTYLWDLICQPNKLLFKDGINMIILNIPYDDSTSNINIICPTNVYSLNKYDKNKDTIIILQKYEYFEPIYIVQDESKTNIMSLSTIKLYTPELFSRVPHLKIFSDTINDIYSSRCKPMSSLPNKYKYKQIKFKRNITLEKTKEILEKYNIDIEDLVINYDNKVVGVNISKDGSNGFIPCFPSGIISGYELVDIENDENSKSMEETLQFLKLISDTTNNEILCKPIVKIIEDELVIGVLTETNQLIPLIEPEQNTDESIKYTINDDNFIQVNKITQISKKQDKTREKYVKKVKLETELYNTFRNTLRKLLNNYKNRNARSEIEEVANSPRMLYYTQLEKLILLLESLMNDNVNFIPNNEDNIKIIEDNLKSDGDILLIPKTNLLSNLDNREIYYSKLSDELIRYVRIKQFMFKPKMFLSFTNLEYNLSDNEIILLQSLLTQDYFDDLIPDNKSKYVSFTSYDTVEPNTTVPYDNTYNIKIENKTTKNIKLDNIQELDSKSSKAFKIYNNCPITKKDIFAKLKLKFRGGYKEINFSSENTNCSFDVVLTMVNNYNSETIDVLGVKKILVDEYNKLFDKYPADVVSLLDYYGYILSSKQLATNSITLEYIIMSDSYYITNFDLLLISNKFNIPVTLIAPHTFKENNNEYLCFNINNNNTFIIRTPGVNKYKHQTPKYKMIVNKGGEGLLSIRELPEIKIQDEINSQQNNIIEILEKYKDIDSVNVENKNVKLKTKLNLK